MTFGKAFYGCVYSLPVADSESASWILRCGERRCDALVLYVGLTVFSVMPDWRDLCLIDSQIVISLCNEALNEPD
ncbi:MAG: hypothetical protein KGQ58_09235 [Proteobacteria bacterium]|nr:hypothetical protein [Pseudomonadota bacterium]